MINYVFNFINNNINKCFFTLPNIILFEPKVIINYNLIIDIFKYNIFLYIFMI